MEFLYGFLAGLGTGIVIDQLFSSRIVTAIKKELNAVETRIAAMLQGVAKKL